MGALHWDLFCRVIDNHGDLGVCWRLARDLARRGHRLRLYIDDATALRWMAPAGERGVLVLDWGAAEGDEGDVDVDVVVEAFGCDPPDGYIAAMASVAPGRSLPVWINLEYLSAEDYVERSHGLPSPRMADPGRGLVKWFVYPGYTDRSGGLLREPGLLAERERFDRAAWLAAQGIGIAPNERLVSLFCYPDAPFDRLIDALAAEGRPTWIATAPGAATAGIAACMPRAPLGVRHLPMPWLPLDDYDRLLWASDLNFVRGEDSWVRAQWAGNPFVWQAYPQDDGAQRAKVHAFVDRLVEGRPAAIAADWRRWHVAWNALAGDSGALPAWTGERLAAIAEAARAWRDGLARQADLASNLLAIVQEKR